MTPAAWLPALAGPADAWGALCRGPLLASDLPSLLLLLAAAPLLEEWVVRAGLQAWCLRRPAWSLLATRWGSTACCALAFAVLHLPRGLFSALCVLPAAVLLGGVYLLRHRWLDCALLHALFNLIAWLACARLSQ